MGKTHANRLTHSQSSPIRQAESRAIRVVGLGSGIGGPCWNSRFSVCVATADAAG